MGMREAVALFQGHQSFCRAVLNFIMAGGLLVAPGMRHDLPEPRGRSGFIIVVLHFLWLKACFILVPKASFHLPGMEQE